MKIALDWTPNVMHSGLYIAKAKGWLDIDFISPSVDDYSVMPSEKVVSGLVDFSIGPPESLIAHHLETNHPQLLALAPILHKNTSSIVALQEKDIHSVADWSGKTYAALGIAFEEKLLQNMIQQHNSNANLLVTTPLKLDTWNMLKNGEVDLTWIFLPIEGTEAIYKEIPLTIFPPEDMGVPYPACPIIKTSRNLAEADPDAIMQFLKAAQRGYQYAVDYPEEAVACLRKGSENNWIEDARLLLECQKAVNDYYLDANKNWGIVNTASLAKYMNWLYDKAIIDRKPDIDKMIYRASIPT
jgi:NitT/TauT family transport system substrate-binding protein